MQKCISLNSKKEWDEALKGINHSFAFTFENCHAMSLTTGFNTFLYCYEKEDVKIVCPLSERSYNGYTDIVTPYGFSGFAISVLILCFRMILILMKEMLSAIRIFTT